MASFRNSFQRLLDDGASGAWEIARNEGVTIVQDLKEAPFPSMPLNALESLCNAPRPRARHSRIDARLESC